MPPRPDRAGQRAGHRRALRPVRQRGRAAPAHPVVPAHHRLRPAPARRHVRAGRLARARPHHAAQLDRPLRGRPGGLPPGRRLGGDPGLHDAPRHALRGDLLHPRARAPRARAAGGRPARGAGGARLRGGRGARLGGRPRRRRAPQDGGVHRAHGGQPGQRRADPGVGGRLRPDGLRHRGDHGRPRPRRARLRLRAGPRPPDRAGHRARGRGRRRAPRRGLHGPGAPGELGLPRRHDGGGGHAGGGGLAGRARPRRGDRRLPPARLADLAPALLGGADPGRPLPRARRRAGARRPAAGAAPRGQRLRAARPQPAGVERGLRQHHLPGVRRPGPARDRHDGHLRQLGLVLPALHGAPPVVGGLRPRGGRLLAADRPVHRRDRARDPPPALRALLHQGALRRRPAGRDASRSRACSRRG